MKRAIIAIAALLALVGCEKGPERPTPAGKDFTVDTLFTHDGCTVYRFSDAGYLRYFTNCSGTTMTHRNENYRCGKNQYCTRTLMEDVPGGKWSNE